MLFAYKFVPHQMDRMQVFIDYIFYEVWCKAPWETYSIDLFDSCPDLKEIIEGLNHQKPSSADFFLRGIIDIFNHFHVLNTIDILRIKKWYISNNNLEKICCKTDDRAPIRYKYLGQLFNGKYEGLRKSLKSFFSNLYSDDFLGLRVIANKIGDIDDHYHAFMQENKLGKCAFCGLSDIKGIYHSKREAYDHYLPKSLYPFNSINFKNLVPACHDCNSSYKLSKDPTLTPKDPCNLRLRRKIFYPYMLSNQPIQLSIKITSLDMNNIKPEEIEIEFNSVGCSEEIETWKDIYGIEERYKAKCCSKGDGKYWLEQVFDEWQEDGRCPSDLLRTLSRQAQRQPFADNNFLKKAFLDACDQANFFPVPA